MLVGLTQHIKWVLATPFAGVKWPSREANHSSQPNAKVKNAWSATLHYLHDFMAWFLIKRRINFTFRYHFFFVNVRLTQNGMK
jgi:hypothetical protein